MIDVYFKRTGHDRPSAYYDPEKPEFGVRLYEHRIVGEDIALFAAWLHSVYKSQTVDLSNEVSGTQGSEDNTKLATHEDQIVLGSQGKRSKKKTRI
jgi:hypothetical protein